MLPGIHRVVLVEVERDDVGEAEPLLAVQPDQLAVDADRRGAGGEAEHRRACPAARRSRMTSAIRRATRRPSSSWSSTMTVRMRSWPRVVLVGVVSSAQKYRMPGPGPKRPTPGAFRLYRLQGYLRPVFEGSFQRRGRFASERTNVEWSGSRHSPDLGRPRPARKSGQGTGAAHCRGCFTPRAVGGQLEAAPHACRPGASCGAAYPGVSAGTEHPDRPAGLAAGRARLVLALCRHGISAVAAASADALLDCRGACSAPSCCWW